MKPLLKVHTAMQGYYRFEKARVDSTGTEIPGTRSIVVDWFPNLITNQGLERMGANSGWMTACQVGTGNDTPAFTDTGLETFLFGTTNFSSNSTSTQPSSPYYAANIRTWRFTAGQATGNVSEVGVGWATSGATLFSRALILDGGGLPTTITVLADEILDVTYQMRFYPPEIDTTGTFNISGISYDYTARAALVTSFSGNNTGGWGSVSTIGDDSGLKGGTTSHRATNGAIGAITGDPAGSIASCTAVASDAYIPGSLERTGTVTWGISATNIGSYLSFRISFGWGSYQMELDPVVPKTSINTLSLAVQHSWGRATIP